MTKWKALTIALISGFLMGLMLYQPITYALIFSLLAGASASIDYDNPRPGISLAILLLLMVFIVSNPLAGFVYGYVVQLIVTITAGVTRELSGPVS